MLRSASAAVQSTIVAAVKGELLEANKYRPTDVIELTNDNERTYLLEPYCLDFDKENPGASDRFSMAALWLAAGVARASIHERFDVGDADLLIAEKAVAAVKRR